MWNMSAPTCQWCLRRTRCLQRITESQHMANCALKSSADSFFGFANLEVQMSMLIGLWPDTNSSAQPSASHQNNSLHIECIFVGLWMTLTCTQGHWQKNPWVVVSWALLLHVYWQTNLWDWKEETDSGMRHQKLHKLSHQVRFYI